MGKKNILTHRKKLKIKQLVDTNMLSDAQQLCTQICNTNKLDIEAWTLLGLIERKLGNYSEAETAVRHALKLNIKSPDAHQILGTTLQCQGKLESAISSYKTALELKPNLTECHYLLGNAYREAGNYTEADQSYQNTIKQQPNNVAALSNRGALLISLEKLDEAVRCLKKAHRILPNAPQLLCNLALVYQKQDKPDDAISYCKKALKIDANFIDAIRILADLYEQSNQYEKAQLLINKGLVTTPLSINLNLSAARIERSNGETAAAITRLESLRKKLPKPEQQDILLLLGELHDKIQNTDRAFEYMCEGKSLKAQALLSLTGKKQLYIERINAQRQQFFDDAPENWSTIETDDFNDNPVFLFGFPRSGTTLLEQILDSHPKLQAITEKPIIQTVEEHLKGRQLSSLTLEEIRQLRKLYFKTAGQYVPRNKKCIYLDKQPLNTVQVQLIWKLFPNAKCILAIRHPCDVVLSCFMQNFAIKEATATFFSLHDTAVAYAGVMSLWQDYTSILKINYHQIRYEDLVNDQLGETKRLINFLGLKWDDQVLHQDKHAQSHHISTPSYHQVTKPIYQDAKFRWKRYEKHMQEVLPILQPYIKYFDYNENVDNCSS